MAQINLLKQTGGGFKPGENLPKVLVWILLAIVLGLGGYYLFTFVKLSSLDKKIIEVQGAIAKDKALAMSLPNREELLTRQQQLKAVNSLIAGHVYWSQFFPELARVTLKTATYTGLQVSLGNDLSLNVSVPTLNDMDSYAQVFNQDKFNENFYNVHINSFSKVQTKTSSLVNFTVKMQYDPKLIQYKPQADNGH